MFQKRSLTTGFLVASLGLGAGLAVFASPNVASAGDTVDCGALKNAKVKGTCTAAKGDKKKIQDAMKDAVKEYKKANPAEKIDCKSCHNDDGSSKSNAGPDFDAKLAKHYK
jgi:ABC-type glycerol-3-phosphate transport system substrate-binding protein